MKRNPLLTLKLSQPCFETLMMLNRPEKSPAGGAQIRMANKARKIVENVVLVNVGAD